MNEEINKIINWVEMSYTRLNYKEELLLVNYIKQLQQENARLKDKIEKVIEYVKHYETIRGYYEYVENGYDEYNYEEDLKEELLEMLKEN